MRTLLQTAERLARLYDELERRQVSSLSESLDVLFDAVADLDLLLGFIASPDVRAMLDATENEDHNWVIRYRHSASGQHLP